jgi:hypothetical protein
MNWFTATVAMPAARHPRRQHRAGQVDLGHDPAAEDVAIGVDVGGQRHHAHHQFGAVGQTGGPCQGLPGA